LDLRRDPCPMTPRNRKFALTRGSRQLLAMNVIVSILTLALAGCGKESAISASRGEDAEVKTLGTVEVTARLTEIPEGAIIQPDLYDDATILKYEVISTHRGRLDKGSIIYVAQYDPWKPRAEAADNRAKNIGGTLRQFRAGQLHRMALEAPLDDFFMGGIVDKY